MKDSELAGVIIRLIAASKKRDAINYEVQQLQSTLSVADADLLKIRQELGEHVRYRGSSTVLLPLPGTDKVYVATSHLMNGEIVT